MPVQVSVLLFQTGAFVQLLFTSRSGGRAGGEGGQARLRLALLLFILLFLWVSGGVEFEYEDVRVSDYKAEIATSSDFIHVPRPFHPRLSIFLYTQTHKHTQT